MKRRVIMLVLLLVAVVDAAMAQSELNFPPDNQDVILTSTNLPIVWIDVDGAVIDRDERITARMKIIHNGDGQLNWADTVAHPGQTIDYQGYIALRYRGSSSFYNSDKKPYSFRPLTAPLEEGGEKKKVALLGMGKDNNWAFLAPYADKSMMRDLLAFEVSRPWMEYTPQGRYCELYVDGIYYGVYILTEVVSKGKHRINLPDPGEADDEITGGYIMEVNRPDHEVVYPSNYHPVSNTGDIYNDRFIHIQFKSPDYEDLTSDQVNYIIHRIDQMETALWNYSPGGAATYREYLDEANFIDYQIAQELGNNVDAYRLSGKFYKRRDSEDARFKMALWDMNLAYGNSRYYDAYRTNTWMYKNNNTLYPHGQRELVPFWWYKLNTNPEYTEALKSRWAQYRRSNLREDRLMATIDSLATVLTSHGAEQRNSQAWPRWGQYVWPNYYIASDFAAEVAWLKQWLTQRIAWLDSQWDFDPSTAYVLGDVNGDGEIAINDVTMLINYLLDGNVAGIDLLAADCDKDGKIAINDVAVLIQYLLTGYWP